MILDQHGQPISTRDLREPQTAGVRWLAREFDEHPARGLTPERLAGILRQAEDGDLVAQLELADDIEERDGHAYAELAKRKMAVIGLEWSVQPPPRATAAEQGMTEAVAEWLGGLPEFGDVMLGMMDAVLKGFAAHELVWQPAAGGRLEPTFSFTPQRWFTSSPDRRGLMLRSLQATPADDSGLPPKMAEPLRPGAWLMHVHPARSGYLTRNGLVRVLAWPYLFKHYATRDLAEFLEIFGLPLRLGRYPAGASDREKQTLLAAVTAIGHNAAGIIPAGMAIDFQRAADGTEGPFDSMIDRMEAIESKVIVGQTLTAQQGNTGSQALGKVHNEVRHDIRDADARQIEQTINGQLIRLYCTINFAGADPRRLPRFALDTGEAEDIAVYATNLPRLAQAGLQIGVDWAHDRLRIPKAKDGQPVISGAGATAPGADATGLPAGTAAQSAAGLQAALVHLVAALAARPTLPAAAGSTDALDPLIAAAAADWQPVLGPMVQPLLAELDKAVAAGESLQAFAQRLPEIVAAMDSSALGEHLARAAFVGRLAGESGAQL